jgi:hypothetical protein
VTAKGAAKRALHESVPVCRAFCENLLLRYLFVALHRIGGGKLGRLA